MDKKQRNRIIENFVQLADFKDTYLFKQKLVEKNVFSREEVNDIFSHPDSYHRKRDLLFRVMKKPPNTYDKLIEAFRESGQKDLSMILEKRDQVINNFHMTNCFRSESIGIASPLSQSNSSSQYEEPPPQTPVVRRSFNYEKLIINVIHSTRFYDQDSAVPVYKTRSKNRGKIIIINNYDFTGGSSFRNGAEVDNANLYELFSQIGFQVDICNNLTAEQMEQKLINFATEEEGDKNFDICAVFLMSHGDGEAKNTKILGTDEQPIYSNRVEEIFNNLNCKKFLGKPKLIFYQVCRGKNVNFTIKLSNNTPAPPNTQLDNASGTENDGEQRFTYNNSNSSEMATTTSENASNNSQQLPFQVYFRSHDDMLLGYSTLDGYVANRDPIHGTWYVEEICKIFMEHAHDKHVFELLQLVDEAFRKKVSERGTMQTAHFHNMGCKNVYLHPGIYEGPDGKIRKIHDDSISL